MYMHEQAVVAASSSACLAKLAPEPDREGTSKQLVSHALRQLGPNMKTCLPKVNLRPFVLLMEMCDSNVLYELMLATPYHQHMEASHLPRRRT